LNVSGNRQDDFLPEHLRKKYFEAPLHSHRILEDELRRRLPPEHTTLAFVREWLVVVLRKAPQT
jgi:hypothetical protein